MLIEPQSVVKGGCFKVSQENRISKSNSVGMEPEPRIVVGVADVNSGTRDTERDNDGDEEGFTHESERETVPRGATERAIDHFLFAVLQVVGKVCSVCPVLRAAAYRRHANEILGGFG